MHYTLRFGIPNVRLCPKLILIMKLTTFILIATMLHVSAAGFGQKITVSARNAPMEKVFQQIRKQAGVDFFFDAGVIKSAGRVNFTVANASLEDALKKCFEGKNLDYVINDKSVIVSKRSAGLLERLASVFVSIDIRGKVMDESGSPLTGASVQIKGTSKFLSTNASGEFSFTGIEEGAVIIIKYIGYVTQEIAVRSDNAGNLRVNMKMDVGKLSEVAVVSNGYQTLTKERSAGSVARANMDVIANRTTSMNVLQSLDGLIPGLVVNNVPNRSQILVRGLSTTGGSTGTGTTSQPLYVVDGLAMPPTNTNDNIPDMIAGINPQDIKSIEVLKDATAASIWGARAANGVIVITTKSGSFNSKLRVNYNAFVNFQGKPDLDYMPVLNSRQYVQSGIELFNAPAYQGSYPWATVSALNGGGITPLDMILYNQSRKLISSTQAAASLDSLSNLDNHGQIKDLFYRNAMLSNQTLSLSGGSSQYSFYGSASYTNTVSDEPGEKNQNYKLNLRQDIKANQALSFYVITDLSNNNTSKKRISDIDYSSVPYQLFRDGNGNNLNVNYLTNQSDSVIRSSAARARINLDYNPLNEFDYGNTKSDGMMVRLNTGFKLKLFKGLRAEGTYGYVKSRTKIREYESLQSYTVRKEVATFAVAATPAVVPKYYLPANGGRLTNTNNEQHKWDVRNQLIYDDAWGKHQLTVLAGQEAQEQFTTSASTRVRGFDETLLTPTAIDYATIGSPVLNTVYPNISTLASSMISDAFSTYETTTRFTSYYANLAYTYDRKYAFNASWRNDQSNLFGKDKSAQNKPIWSAGGKWNIGFEDFMKPVDWVQQLSLRVTYGITGNSPEAGVAASQDITGPTGSAFFPGSIGMRVITPGNPDLSWERTATTNIGLDFSILNSRLSASIDLYQKKTTNLLGLVYPNSLTGFTSVVGNQGDMTNKGIELSLNTLNIAGRDFSWSTNLVFAYNKNKVDKITMLTPITSAAQQVLTTVAEGYPAYTLFAYKYGGLDHTGAPQVILADGTVTTARNVAKPQDAVYMGSTQPVWNGGFSNTFQYRQFKLSANMVYNMGHVMRRQRNLMFGGQLRRNVSVDFLNRWKVPGDEAFTNIPGMVFSTANETNYFTQGDVNVVSASFVKLRDITLFYSIPQHLADKIRAQGITFRAQVSNVMVWKANKFGIDPEFQGAIPNNQNTISLGANISF
jgi:TonB-linked SusC/RagA family outer membrane protein